MLLAKCSPSDGGHQEAWAVHQGGRAVEAVIQGQGHLIAMLADDRQRGAFGHAIGPHLATRGALPVTVRILSEIATTSARIRAWNCAVCAGGRIKAQECRRWLQVALKARMPL